MENQSNPLSNYFRQPSIYITLPSNGQYWEENSIQLNVTGELPVFPMTARDEIILKTPDALLNGSGVADVIASCIPSIKDPWKIPAIDLDKILIAIRLATYGHDMDFRQSCPSCKDETEYSIDLRVVLDNIKAGDYSSKFTSKNGLTFKFKPHDFARVNKANIMSFEEQRILAVATNTEMNEADRVRMFNESLNKITNMTLDALTASIESISMPNNANIVSDQALIKDFLNNTDATTYSEVKTKIESLANDSKLAPLHLQCPECKHEFDTTLTFDQSHFFG